MSKYGAKKVTYDGKTFDSKKEASNMQNCGCWSAARSSKTFGRRCGSY